MCYGLCVIKEKVLNEKWKIVWKNYKQQVKLIGQIVFKAKLMVLWKESDRLKNNFANEMELVDRLLSNAFCNSKENKLKIISV